jgi:cytoskeletal protein CcmA (bactofilin family)
MRAIGPLSRPGRRTSNPRVSSVKDGYRRNEGNHWTSAQGDNARLAVGGGWRNQIPARKQQFQRLAVAESASPKSAEEQSQHLAVAESVLPRPEEEISSISSDMTIVGKISCEGTVKIFGSIEGELHATTVLIADGAQVEGEINAEDLTIGGRVKGTIHANRVKLIGTAIVEGDIFHQSLAIEEHARFEGASRRKDDVVDASSNAQVNRPQSQTKMAPIEGHRKLNGPPDEEEHAKPAAE